MEYTLKFSPEAAALMVCPMMNDLDICRLNVALSARQGGCELRGILSLLPRQG